MATNPEGCGHLLSSQQSYRKSEVRLEELELRKGSTVVTDDTVQVVAGRTGSPQNFCWLDAQL